MTPFDLDAARKDLAALAYAYKEKAALYDPPMDVEHTIRSKSIACADHLPSAIARIEKLEEALTRAQNDAVCHCGSPVSEHSWGDGHMPVPMEHPCPYEKTLRDLERWMEASIKLTPHDRLDWLQAFSEVWLPQIRAALAAEKEA
jgi:hypothetical protein